MKILALADRECPALWDYYTPGRLADYDLIISCGDLKASYLSFLVTMARAPLFYVHGNHDTHYDIRGPEGCNCIDDKLVIYRELRIIGLGGSRNYNNGKYQYTDLQMSRRWKALRNAIELAGGLDIVVAHAAPLGLGDGRDNAHIGFEAFNELIDKYRPAYLLHGHLHMNYGKELRRVHQRGETKIVNCFERRVIEFPAPDTCALGLKRHFSKKIEIIR